VADREPDARLGRHNGDMNSPAVGSPHADHDLELVASILDRSTDEATRTVAGLQVASCDECARLLADLQSISAGLQALPRAIPVPRDFTISPEQAARLRRGNGWRRLLRPFGAQGIPSLQPLAAVLTTLGLAGLLLTSGGSALLGAFSGAASAPGSIIGSSVDNQPERAATDKAAPTNAAAPGAVLGSLASPHAATPLAPAPGSPPAPAAGSPQPALGGAGAPTDLGASSGNFGAGGPAAVPPASEPPPAQSPLVILSATLLAVGLGLFLLRLAARRLA
jgi:hypothetical protein